MIALHGFKAVVLTQNEEELPTGDRTTQYGDSITSGASATSSELAYPAVYESITGMYMRTMSAYSRTVQEAVQPWNATNSLYNVMFNPTSDQAQYNPTLPFDPTIKYIGSQLGVNDALQQPGTNTNAQTFKTAYLQCWNRLLELGWPKNRLKIANIIAYLGTNQQVKQNVIEYNLVIGQISQELGIELIDVNAFVHSFSDMSAMFSDDVHLTNLGHARLGQFWASKLP